MVDLSKDEKMRMTSNVFRDAINPIIIEDLDGVVFELNEEAVRTYGWKRGELIGQKIKTIVPPDRHDQADDLLARAKAGEIVRNIEGLRWTREGAIIPVLLALSVIKDDAGKPVGIATIAKDISEQKRVEEELRRYRDHLKDMVDERTLELERKKDQIEELSQKLSKYLSPQVYESIFKGQWDAKIESQRKKLTIFFSDIVQFTATTDKMEPEDLSRHLNIYLDAMSAIALKYGGTIDKFIGDAIMIFFGAPKSSGVKEDALACVKMVIEMKDALETMQRKWLLEGMADPFKVRFGVNTGHCTVGNFGSKSKMDYTIIGGQVNVAKRLQQVSDPDQITISRETWSLVKDDIYCIKKLPVNVKGIPDPVQTYQVIDEIKNLKLTDYDRTVATIVEQVRTCSPDTRVGEIMSGFDAKGSDVVIVVGEDGVPQGLVAGHRLAALAQSEGLWKAMSDDPISSIMYASPLVVESSISFGNVALQAVGRETEHIYDPVIVTERGKFLGTVPVHLLLEKILLLEDEKTSPR